jgi:urease accessory protein
MTLQTAPVLPSERSHGAARVVLRAGPDRGRLERLHQSGSAKAFVHAGEAGPEVVFLNTSGGLTGGDRMTCGIELGAGVRAGGTTQTAERAYRSPGGAAAVTVRHAVGPGAHLDWLPQETILFDHSQLMRETRIDLAADATCLMLEMLVLGRAAMGEHPATLHLRDTRRVMRAGQPVLVEPLHLTPAALTAGPAVLEGARALATLALVAPGAADALAPVRAALDEPGTRGGASAFDGKLMIRLLADDGWPLRRQVARLLAVLRPGPLPRVWQT